jgi:hypothetical protein
MLKASKYDYLGNTLATSKILASRYAKIVQKALSKTPGRTSKNSNKAVSAEQLSSASTFKIAQGDIKRKLHERLDFVDKSAYIGVMLCPEELPTTPIKAL